MPGFLSLQGDLIVIAQEYLDKYPNSFLSLLTKSKMRRDKKGDNFKTKISTRGLIMVQYFFLHNIWENPHIKGNQIEIGGIVQNFQNACDFLGLPDDFEEIKEEKQKDCEECPPLDYDEDDFQAEWSIKDEQKEDYDDDSDYCDSRRKRKTLFIS